MELLLFIIGILIGAILMWMRYDAEPPRSEPWPHYQPEGPNSVWWGKIAGINYREGIGQYVTRDRMWREARLVDEPTNEYDPNAIRIEDKDTGHHLGYVPRGYTFAVRTWTRRHRNYRVEYDIKLLHDPDGKGYFDGKFYLIIVYDV